MISPCFLVYCVQYSLASSREERKNLYSVLFDYILHQINETCFASGVNEYSDDEIQPLAALLAQTNAPEAFYISVKLGVEGIGEILRRSIASALSRYPNSERLNMVLLYSSFLISCFDSLRVIPFHDSSECLYSASPWWT